MDTETHHVVMFNYYMDPRLWKWFSGIVAVDRIKDKKA